MKESKQAGKVLSFMMNHHPGAPQVVAQACSRSRPTKAVVVSIARCPNGLVEASAVLVEAAESLAQDATASALIHNSIVQVNVSEAALVVVNKRHQVSYLFAHNRRTFVADRFEVRRQSLARGQVLVEPPKRLHRVNYALVI